MNYGSSIGASMTRSIGETNPHVDVDLVHPWRGMEALWPSRIGAEDSGRYGSPPWRHREPPIVTIGGPSRVGAEHDYGSHMDHRSHMDARFTNEQHAPILADLEQID